MLLDLIQSLEEKLALLRGCSGGPAALQQQHLQQLVSHMTQNDRQQDVSAAAEPPLTTPLHLPPFSLCQNASLAQLMEQVLEMESLSNQVLRWREVPSSQSQSATWCSDGVSDRST